MDYDVKIEKVKATLKALEAAYIKQQGVLEFLTAEKEAEEKTDEKKGNEK